MGFSVNNSSQGQGGLNEISAQSSVVSANLKSKSTASNTGAATDIPQVKNLNLSLDEHPTLASNTSTRISMQALNSLSSEAIMSLLGFEERESAVESGKASLEAHREERAAANEERIKLLQEQAEKLESKSLLNKFKMAFQIIGCVLGAIAGIAAAAASVATGNILMGVGAVLTLFTIADQITQLASGGEHGITQEIVKIAEKNGSNTLAASIAMNVIMLGIGLGGAIMSCGGSGAFTGVARMVNTGVNAFSGANSVALGSTNVASAIYDYQLEHIKADSKDLEAILMRIQIASQLDSDNIQQILEKSQNMSESVKEILDSCNQSLGAVVTSAPAMA